MKFNLIPTNFRKGFSIIEVVIALGIVALMSLTFLGVFGPAQKKVQRNISTKEVNSLKDAVSNELSLLRSSEVSLFTDSFDKAVNYIIESHDKSTAVLVYSYRANPDGNNTNGILPVFTGTNGVPGRDVVIQTAVRKIGKDDALLTEELSKGVVEGSVFVVRMTQLLNDGNELVLNDDVDVLKDPDTGDTVDDTADFNGAFITFNAEFYRLPSNLYDFVVSDNWGFNFTGPAAVTNTNTLGSPVLETNIAVRR